MHCVSVVENLNIESEHELVVSMLRVTVSAQLAPESYGIRWHLLLVALDTWSIWE